MQTNSMHAWRGDATLHLPPSLPPCPPGGLDFSAPVKKFFYDPLGSGRAFVNCVVSLTGFALVGGPARQDAPKAVEALKVRSCCCLQAPCLPCKRLGGWLCVAGAPGCAEGCGGAHGGLFSMLGAVACLQNRRRVAGCRRPSTCCACSRASQPATLACCSRPTRPAARPTRPPPQNLNVPYLVSLPLVFQTTEEWLDSELGVHPVQVALQVRNLEFLEGGSGRFLALRQRAGWRAGWWAWPPSFSCTA